MSLKKKYLKWTLFQILSLFSLLNVIPKFNNFPTYLPQILLVCNRNHTYISFRPDKSAILLHPGTPWNKNLCAKDAGCAGNKITVSGHHTVPNIVDTRHTVMPWKTNFSPELFHSEMVFLLRWSIPRLLRSLRHSSFSQKHSRKIFLVFFFFFFCFVFLFKIPNSHSLA